MQFGLPAVGRDADAVGEGGPELGEAEDERDDAAVPDDGNRLIVDLGVGRTGHAGDAREIGRSGAFFGEVEGTGVLFDAAEMREEGAVGKKHRHGVERAPLANEGDHSEQRRAGFESETRKRAAQHHQFLAVRVEKLAKRRGALLRRFPQARVAALFRIVGHLNDGEAEHEHDEGHDRQGGGNVAVEAAA